MVKLFANWFRKMSAIQRTPTKDVTRLLPKTERAFRGERLIFVGGAPRSGTTLLQQVLDSHSEIYGGTEFDSIPSIVHVWRSLVANLESGRITAFCTRRQIDEAVGSMIEKLLLPVADQAKARFMSEKTPFNVLVFKDLLELFPACRAIQIVRDPRAVIGSMMKVGERYRNCGETALPDFTENLNSAIQLTRNSLDAGFAAAKLFPQRVLTLKYEELVRNPEESARALCYFLNIYFDRQMLRPDLKKNETWDDVARLDKGIWYDPAIGLSRPIEANRIDSWKNLLSPEHLDAINSSFRDFKEMTALGYHFE